MQLTPNLRVIGCSLGCSSPPCGAVHGGPGKGHWCSLNRSGRPRSELLMRLRCRVQGAADCCQHCCQAARQRPTGADRGGTSAQRTDRNGRPWTAAYEHLDRAREIAASLGENRDDFGTEFGPTNVALHAVSVAVELGDAEQALDLARNIEAEQLSSERQARYLIDLAQAHAMRRQTGEALHCLQEAERLTPEQTRTHRVARAVARDLIKLSGSRPRPELRELAERFGVLP